MHVIRNTLNSTRNRLATKICTRVVDRKIIKKYVLGGGGHCCRWKVRIQRGIELTFVSDD